MSDLIETHDKRTETHACDCISRQAAIDAIRDTTLYGIGECNDILRLAKEVFRTELMMLPAAQPERKTGKWVEVTDGICIWKVCDQCGNKPLWNEWRTDRCESSYCPNCGAKMEVEHDT